MSKSKYNNSQLNKVDDLSTQEPEVTTTDEPIEPVIVQMDKEVDEPRTSGYIEVIEEVELAPEVEPDPIEEKVEAAPNMYHVKSRLLNIRRGPSKSYEAFKQVTDNDNVEVLEIESEWARIMHNSEEGYAMTQYLEKI